MKSIALDRVDWNLLHTQKQDLLHAIDVYNLPSLEGLVDLIDRLQDDAETAGVWKHPEA